MAHRQTKYKNEGAGYIKTRAEMYLVFIYRITHTETQLQQWFSGFISKTTPLQVCKGELIWFLRGHISSTC
jgi:hypothetical protein